MASPHKGKELIVHGWLYIDEDLLISPQPWFQILAFFVYLVELLLVLLHPLFHSMLKIELKDKHKGRGTEERERRGKSKGVHTPNN